MNAFNQLLMDGALALSRASHFGMRIDMGYLRNKVGHVGKSIERSRRALLSTEEGKLWGKMSGEKLNLDSGPQLSALLFSRLGLKPVDVTEKGNPRTDDHSLKVLAKEAPFLTPLLAMRKEIKTLQYLELIQREQVDGFIHPAFNLHTVRTYRSSSNDPNFQNIPIRDPVQGKAVRRCFVPRKGRRIVEMDFGGIEVRVAACYHKDPAMLTYINDPTKDLHRDMAAECFRLPVDKVTKEIRYYGKNGFVFPAFYGSYWAQIAPNLWDASDKLGLRPHLAAQGLRTLAQFEDHIKKVERRFWHERFPVYNRWKEKWWRQYLARGYIDGLTGFRCTALMGRNDCINYPIQGAAFHCLLWSFIRLDNFVLEHGLSQSLVGQIHDSIVMDAKPEEMEGLVSRTRRIIRKELPAEWKWIIVPLEVETEVGGIDEPWNAKEKFITAEEEPA